MSTTRRPDLEDFEQPDKSLVAGELENQLNTAGKKMSQALVETTQREATQSDEKTHVRLLVVDDNQVFLESISDTAKKLKEVHVNVDIQIESLIPKKIDDVRECIISRFDTEHEFDYVLLDFAFAGKDFNGLGILQDLHQSYGADLQAKLAEEIIRLRLVYLPVAIVTRGGSALGNKPFFEEHALGVGADKIYADKGSGSIGAGESEARLSPEPLLTSLVKGGFKEMRFRAWARLWQDLCDQMEEGIKQQLDANKWIDDEKISNALTQVWQALAIPIKAAGYADHLSMHILKTNEKKEWQLHKIGSTDDPNDPEAQKFDRFLKKRAMMTRIGSKQRPTGIFFISRKAKKSPFFKEDQTNLHSVVERLGLFHRELLMRKRHHDRQIALVDLGTKLLDEEFDKDIVTRSVNVLHEYLHRSRSVFTEKATDNAALNGRVIPITINN